MKTVVTGGGGFLGAELVRQLRTAGHEVVVVGRGRYPAVEAQGARCVPWDLAAEQPGLERVFDGAEIVFHTAARAGVWGRRDEFWGINVDGTRRVLDACRAAGTPKLVYTSSPSCTFDGRDHAGATEADCPYPSRFEAFYPETKAEAERLVLGANGPGLATTALRPHLIWGPGDPHLLPRLISRQRAGRLARVGDGQNRVGLTYVDNAAAAHVQAAAALAPGSANAGKAYFVTDPEPVTLWPWIDRLLVAVGAGPVKRAVPLGLARVAGTVLEGVWRLFALGGEPPMTRFVASQLATSHWYDLRGGRADFGLAAITDPETGFQRAVDHFKIRP